MSPSSSRLTLGLVSVLAFAALAGGCSSNDSSSGGGGNVAFGTMFQTPSGTATPDRLDGLWGGKVDRGDLTFDLRLRFAGDSLTAAARCQWTDGTQLIAGAKGASRTSQKPDGDISCFPLDPGGPKTTCGEVQILDSVTDRQSAGDKWCAIAFSPSTYRFQLEGTKARVTGGGETMDLVKLSD